MQAYLFKFESGCLISVVTFSPEPKGCLGSVVCLLYYPVLAKEAADSLGEVAGHLRVIDCAVATKLKLRHIS